MEEDKTLKKIITFNITKTLSRDYLDGLGDGYYYLVGEEKYYKIEKKNDLYQLLNPNGKKYKEDFNSFINYKNSYDGNCLGLIPLTEKIFDEIEKLKMIPKSQAELFTMDLETLNLKTENVMVFMPEPIYYF